MVDPSRAGPHTSSTGYASNKHSVLAAPRGQDGIAYRWPDAEVPRAEQREKYETWDVPLSNGRFAGESVRQ